VQVLREALTTVVLAATLDSHESTSVVIEHTFSMFSIIVEFNMIFMLVVLLSIDGIQSATTTASCTTTGALSETLESTDSAVFTMVVVLGVTNDLQ
jgi:hypothetical protein